ncbi:MAG TPA: hypothetical protein QGI72_02735, partial [Poseidonia sp.]|nr:hypothetical protein [Poseidonia sp.]
MRKLTCWLIIIILSFQASLYAIDSSDSALENLEDERNEEDTHFAGRQSAGMNSNNTTNSGCNTTEWMNGFDGLGGPVWQNGSDYYTNEIVEWPANSGQFWQMTSNGSTNDPPETVGGPDSDWVGPCRCSEIGAASAMVWDSTANYSAWQIVEHNGTYWIAQDAGAEDYEPGNEGASGASSDYWAPCSQDKPCSTFNGHGGPVWDSATSYSVNDTVEWPANSGHFWQSTTSGPTSEPSLNGKWMGACSCADIAEQGGVEHWDVTLNYNPWEIVLYDGAYWIAQSAGVTAGEEVPEFSELWEQCSGNASGGPCSEVIGVATEVWSSTTIVNAGDIYEYPANSSVFWLVEDGIGNQTVGAPGVDADAWAPESCQCEDIWTDSGGPSWDATITYPVNSVVLYTDAAGVQNLYIAWASPGPGDEPSTDPEWRLCGGEEP